MFMDVNPIPVKEAMNLMGLDVGECRLPLYGMDDAAKSKLASVLRKYRLMK
jgi:4-hydroxy-tetrahydrodipicolinate synthase